MYTVKDLLVHKSSKRPFKSGIHTELINYRREKGKMVRYGTRDQLITPSKQIIVEWFAGGLIYLRASTVTSVVLMIKLYDWNNMIFILLLLLIRLFIINPTPSELLLLSQYITLKHLVQFERVQRGTPATTRKVKTRLSKATRPSLQLDVFSTSGHLLRMMQTKVI